ncbi:GNAT family N-acyltransferase [Sulfuricurvum sp.]|uniref:GNAT family N-acyltransferase n=1 Tax=Sulfuricurvum sp. TaxID=2025608 RepID=UPI002D488D38|nr:GNAT family N-acyltransferase [Sulfuricurvum sp.]HZF70234.1 GNAT family N-acyltransferase [Sulfuricurvum sp.]
MKCTVASTEMERIAILRQRYDIFVEEFNFLAPKEENKRIEYDEYDEHSLLFGVWEDTSLIASCRLVLPNSSFELPTLKAMVIDAKKLDRLQPTAEISRILVASNHRIFKKTIKILQTMQKEINKIASEHNIEQLIGSVEPSFLRLLNCSKLPYQAIGPLQHHIGPDRYPIVLKLHDNVTPNKEYP